jgi:CRP-like cAMP-binding protein
MDLVSGLRRVELFAGLNDAELADVASICEERTYKTGDHITGQGDPGDLLFIIVDGLVEVIRASAEGDTAPKTVVHLGQGQVIGEMALVDLGPRSATIRVISDDAILHAIHHDRFLKLCEERHHLGYVVMRNLAADLSFKLRHQHMAGR